jgi:cyclophilin family peptidyl-prolyl cis-trans isomerase
VSKQSKRDRQRLNREARRQYEEALARRRRAFKTARLFAIFLVPVIAIGAYLSISAKDEKKKSTAVAAGCREVKEQPPVKNATFTDADLTIDPAKTYDATVQTSCGSFTIRLDPGGAPVAVNSFAFLAGQGFYDGSSFYRVAKGFVAQGGSPAGPGYDLDEEPPAAGYQKGTVAMTRGDADHTTSSDFFVVISEDGAASLNAQVNPDGSFRYSILGQITDGFDTIVRINKQGSLEQDPALQVPKAIIVIDKVTVAEAPATP